MAFARLVLCVGGVYAMFLIWGIAQERLSVPFTDNGKTEKWNFALIMGALQSALSALSALTYILLRKRTGETISQAIGLDAPKVIAANGNGTAKQNGHSPPAPPPRKGLLWSYFYCALLGTFAAPFGFASLAHISYPAMVLGKSCKLVPVLIMNVLLYRRKFAPHKYLVVALVTIGITMFMAFGEQKSSKASRQQTSGGPWSSIIGLTYLLINLAMDGVLNSTQDEIFSRYKVTGQQMMLFMNINSALLNAFLAILPLPYIPVLHPSSARSSDLSEALRFLKEHPKALSALFQFAITGALGQLFIFETLQHFGSLTLVTITLTRKLFTMLLSVIVYRHRLSPGQYLGAIVVFAGISTEALIKGKEIHLKRVVQEKETAKIKAL